ncbi:MAG: hydroxymethylglutaryl-CoA lyase [Woeseia sp.]
MAASITIVEVGPRDGLQSEPSILSTETKIEFIRRILDCGIRHVEVASFVDPKRVPQMADAEAIIAGLGSSERNNLIGLVMNRRGFERARDSGVDEAGFVIVASDTFNKRNQGVSIDESIAVWKDIARDAKTAGIRASVMISAAFGCPYEGEIPESAVVDIAKRVVSAEPDEIALADSIGVGVPAQVSSLVGRLCEIAAPIPVRCHFHNTRNTGLANAYAAIEAGTSSLDASIGGMGGCPFAPTATGNIPTEDLVYMLHRSSIRTGTQLDKIIKTSNWLQTQLHHELPAMLPKAGSFPAPAEV